MIPDSRGVLECIDRIRARVGNWIQGNGYGPGGYSRDDAKYDVIFLLSHIDNLTAIADEVDVWQGRYNALLEEAESSRPHEYQGDGEDLPIGAIVLDCEKDAWQRGETGEWWCTAGRTVIALDDAFGPYVVVYIPEGGSKS